MSDMSELLQTQCCLSTVKERRWCEWQSVSLLLCFWLGRLALLPSTKQSQPYIVFWPIPKTTCHFRNFTQIRESPDCLWLLSCRLTWHSLWVPRLCTGKYLVSPPSPPQSARHNWDMFTKLQSGLQAHPAWPQQLLQQGIGQSPRHIGHLLGESPNFVVETLVSAPFSLANWTFWLNLLSDIKQTHHITSPESFAADFGNGSALSSSS